MYRWTLHKCRVHTFTSTSQVKGQVHGPHMNGLLWDKWTCASAGSTHLQVQVFILVLISTISTRTSDNWQARSTYLQVQTQVQGHVRQWTNASAGSIHLQEQVQGHVTSRVHTFTITNTSTRTSTSASAMDKCNGQGPLCGELNTTFQCFNITGSTYCEHTSLSTSSIQFKLRSVQEAEEWPQTVVICSIF